ncbi:hypothetical protein MKW98_006301 [Papaver atlanticum]|uniref:Alpha-soluble NSF attachment protein n=1 Tax=Papaver atlanticum TaxID=357466 RepID=A0AAD4XUB6_9MAGN|nr:hypothetical protein MKW98_006301 [Papaver atlanticum]
MADVIAFAEEFKKKADKQINRWAVFGSKYKDAATWGKAAAAYLKLAAASAYAEAENFYKKISVTDAISCFDQAVNQFMEIGNFNMAAVYCMEIGELYEVGLPDVEKSTAYYKRAADLFQSAEVSRSAFECMQRVAQFSAQLEQYPRAIEIYENLAHQSLNNKFLNYLVKGYLLNAGLCHLYEVDVFTISNALEHFEEMDPTFSGTHEYKFLADLAASVDKEDVQRFTVVFREGHSMIRQDPWKTRFLLRVKKMLKAKEDEQ